MIIYCLNDEEFESLKHWSHLVARLMSQYEWLMNSRLIEFYNEDSWSKLPTNWSTCLDNLEPIHLARWLNDEKMSFRQVMPLGLICLQKVGRLFSFSRKESNLNELDCLIERLRLDDAHRSPYKIVDLNRIDLKHIFIRHLKVKKRHEVGRFSSLINNILGNSNDLQLVDFGSGQGHLDRFLAIYFNYLVTTLELEQNNIKRAGEYDEQAIMYLSKSSKLNYFKSQNENLVLGNLPRHLNVKVTNQNCDELFSKNGLKSLKTSFIGLHACGSLSSDLIKLFSQHDLGRYLFLISCCYHKCDANSFILSNTVTNHDYKWNYESKEIACHSIENYVDQLKTDHSKLKINCYRALLENIFQQHYPSLRFVELAKVRKFERLSFIEYVQSATRNLQVNIDEAHLSNKLIENRLKNYLRVVKFYVLKMLLAPMIENLIQVDRMLYLFESGLQSALIPVFDPKLSPRNFVLFAFKSKQNS